MNIRVRFAPPPTELLRIILILCFIIVPFKTNAEEIDNRNLELGAYLMTPKFSYNFWSNNVHFFINPLFDFGISAAYPLNKNKDVAGLLEVGYVNYAFRENGKRTGVIEPKVKQLTTEDI